MIRRRRRMSCARAWVDMGLDGILCFDGIPVVYFKEVEEIDDDEARDLQRKLWNQGIAPLLLLITPWHVHVYSGLALPAKEGEPVSGKKWLVDTLDRVSDALELRDLARSVEFGDFFKKHADSFNPKHRVDRYLLSNLDAARGKLQAEGELKESVVHALLGRIVFTCYLIDREIVNEEYLGSVTGWEAKRLLDLLEGRPARDARDSLYELFAQLRDDFNGDLFEGALEAEKLLIEEPHIDVIRRFLRGDDLVRGQMSLGFWAYDFSVIPIETISGIYELFLGAEDEDARRKSGTTTRPGSWLKWSSTSPFSGGRRSSTSGSSTLPAARAFSWSESSTGSPRNGAGRIGRPRTTNVPPASSRS